MKKPRASLCCLSSSDPPRVTGFQELVLKWQPGGCYASWCETSWYSSPATADLEGGDMDIEVITSAYSIVVLDGKTGALHWRVTSGHDPSQPCASSVWRTKPDIVVEDLDTNGEQGIIKVHRGGYLSVYNREGYFAPGWPIQPSGGLERCARSSNPRQYRRRPRPGGHFEHSPFKDCGLRFTRLIPGRYLLENGAREFPQGWIPALISQRLDPWPGMRGESQRCAKLRAAPDEGNHTWRGERRSQPC